MKRLFDMLVSAIALVLLAPLFLMIAVAVSTESKGGVFFRQKRIGKNGKPFLILKFRTMFPDSEKHGQLTIGNSDSRITKTGAFLRKWKLDELPQLWNVFKGEMSLVGPRPEVPKYVELYSEKQRQVLSVKPGITDMASILYYEENAILSQSKNPEQTYIEQIMPHKLTLNLEYIRNRSFFGDLKILLKTIGRMFS